MTDSTILLMCLAGVGAAGLVSFWLLLRLISDMMSSVTQIAEATQDLAKSQAAENAKLLDAVTRRLIMASCAVANAESAREVARQTSISERVKTAAETLDELRAGHERATTPDMPPAAKYEVPIFGDEGVDEPLRESPYAPGGAPGVDKDADVPVESASAAANWNADDAQHNA